MLDIEYNNIELDYCEKCRGVWLDRGELDKLIERSAMPQAQRSEYREAPARHAQPVYHEGQHKPHYKHKNKRESFLGELFDFD